MVKTKHCERCWLTDHRMTTADLHIDDRDLCRACVAIEGLDAQDGTPLMQPVAQPQATSSTPLLKGDVLGSAQRRRVANGKARAKDAPVARPGVSVTVAAVEARKCEGPGCENTFLPRKPSQLYCAKACSMRAYWKRHPQAPARNARPARVCEEPSCGKEFVPKENRSRFCSRTCRKRAWYRETHPATNIRPVGPGGKRACESADCQKDFTPKTAAGRFCSQTCYQREHARSKRKERLAAVPLRTCQGDGCTNQFRPKRRDQRFCSTVCRMSARVVTSAPLDVAVKAVLDMTKGTGLTAPEFAARMNAYEQAEQVAARVAACASAVTVNRTATIRVTEKMLDGFWTRLSIDEKAAIVERQLGAEA